MSHVSHLVFQAFRRGASIAQLSVSWCLTIEKVEAHLRAEMLSSVGSVEDEPQGEVAKARRILNEECRRAGLSPDQVIMQSRTRHVATVRRIAMRRVRKETGLSFPEIGRVFDRDPSTVQSACRGLD